MTANQRRAAALATAISSGTLSATSLSDTDWSLLLLAAGTNAVAAPTEKVARRVLERLARGTGYFARGVDIGIGRQRAPHRFAAVRAVSQVQQEWGEPSVN